MNRDLPKWLQVLCVAALVLLALLVFFNRHRMDVYGTYIRESSPSVTIRLADLSADMDEAAVLRHFNGVPLRCVAEDPGNANLGERVCYANIDKADGDAALVLATFFNQGKLVRALVQVPWWVHGVWLQRFNTQYGQAERLGSMLRWKMPNGQVEFDRSRSFNPLEWNVILWTAQKAK